MIEITFPTKKCSKPAVASPQIKTTELNDLKYK